MMQDTRYRIQDKTSCIDHASCIVKSELVITMTLIGIIAYIVANAPTTGITKAYLRQTSARKRDQSRIAMERMTRR